ncbi:uncharacterized protein LOC110934216 [Helianthus annuus]|uniref:uncharacterized protein LOC110934216 n=1 Tax=Helianthus annuus TaxID=4232 RepID=UPI001652C31E|nr:uncharacterized protein LOC110934216 [Helianthus annuus]
MLGLDGAFIKGPYPGQVLSAVGVDPNNGIYPVSYAIVEAETLDSWTWFLEFLGDDLDLDANSNFTFLSDRQKGIIPAIMKVFPFAEHRFCLRHIYENMRLQFKGKAFKDLLWKCATTTTIVEFEKEMDALKSFNSECHLWLSNIPPKHWSRSHFSGRATSDMLLNNMCEVFNSKILEGRDKPIIAMLEFIREYCMRRIVNVLQLIERSDGLLTPYATELFEEIKKDATRYTIIWNGEGHYQVTGGVNQYVVNMEQRTCSCRRWELNGIPCRHAVAAIWNRASHGQVGLPESFVHPVYRMDRWKQVYTFKVYPINGKSMWPRSLLPTTITPPYYHKSVGRPKKTRRKAASELEDITKGRRLRKVGTSGTCGKCGNTGHNSRSCNGRSEVVPTQQTSAKSSKLAVGSKGQKGKKHCVGSSEGLKGKKDVQKQKACRKCKGIGHNSRTCQGETMEPVYVLVVCMQLCL